MRYSVSISVEGDRPMTREEIVEFADAVAPYSGIASGIGELGYGAQIIVDAADSVIAVQEGIDIFIACREKAGLPDWPVLKAETMSEDEDWEDDL
jgi:hypothetical protein